jgi:hypothetical protein
LIVGVDFDNTIVGYDDAFHQAAVERNLIDGSAVRAQKAAVREALRSAGRDAEWTALQGLVYGPRMPAAVALPGALDAIRELRAAGTSVFIVSHKSRYAHAGPRHDLHETAHRWLSDHAVLADGVYFEPTREAKLERIGELGCTHFVDDLPEVLCAPGFPPGVERILLGHPSDVPGLVQVDAWRDLRPLLGLLERSGDRG